MASEDSSANALLARLRQGHVLAKVIRGTLLALAALLATYLGLWAWFQFPLGAAPPPPPRLSPLAPAPSAAVVGGVIVYYLPLLRFGAAGLYTRLDPAKVLDNEARERIRALVAQEPGIHAQDVRARTGLAWGATVYHLRVLARTGILVTWVDGRYRRFALAGTFLPEDRSALGAMRHPTARRLAEEIASRPGVGQKELRRRLDLASPSATWHLQRLERAGVVLAARRGREVHYDAGPAWVRLNER